MSDNNSTQDYGREKTIVNKPLDWKTTLSLSEQAKSLRFMKDKEGNLFAVAAVLFDPTNVGSNILAMGKVSIADPNVPNSNARVFASPQNSVLGTSFTSILAMAQMMVYRETGALVEAIRTPELYNCVATAANGDTALVSIAGGHRCRLFSGVITLSKEAACAGALAIRICAGAGAASVIIDARISAAALVAIGNVVAVPFSFPHNGMVFPDGVDLFVNLSGALTAGICSVSVCYNDEVI